MPLPEDLNAVRNHIVDHPDRFFAILEHDRFRKIFGSLGGDRLQRVPQGFPVDHVAAAYLKYKQFLAARNFPPRVATTPRFYKLVLETFQAILPLVRRSEEHTSELQSQSNLVCRLLLEKKKKNRPRRIRDRTTPGKNRKR